ncbi:MAG: hypothetical protein EOO41_01780 [Methanobacteriota archaeon]|nr:MAG: hypothetical protein EOO41_01780 [Euryarchaeota archaeon]
MSPITSVHAVQRTAALFDACAARLQAAASLSRTQDISNADTCVPPPASFRDGMGLGIAGMTGAASCGFKRRVANVQHDSASVTGPRVPPLPPSVTKLVCTDNQRGTKRQRPEEAAFCMAEAKAVAVLHSRRRVTLLSASALVDSCKPGSESLPPTAHAPDMTHSSATSVAAQGSTAVSEEKSGKWIPLACVPDAANEAAYECVPAVGSAEQCELESIAAESTGTGITKQTCCLPCVGSACITAVQIGADIEHPRHDPLVREGAAIAPACATPASPAYYLLAALPRDAHEREHDVGRERDETEGAPSATLWVSRIRCTCLISPRTQASELTGEHRSFARHSEVQPAADQGVVTTHEWMMQPAVALCDASTLIALPLPMPSRAHAT